MQVIPREICRNMEQALTHEWLVSNGSGSYAAATIAGALTRREHGLLVTPLASAARTVLVAKVDEEVQAGDQLYKLGTNVYANNVVNPDGFLYLQQVTFDGAIPTFWYEAGRFQLTKTIWMPQGRATTYIRYALAEHSMPVHLTLLPLLDDRPIDGLTQGSETWRFQVEPAPRGLRFTARAGAQPFRVLTDPPTDFTPLDLWYWRFQLRAADNALTDLYMPGLIRARLTPGGVLTLGVTAEEDETLESNSWESLQTARGVTPGVPPPPSDRFTPAVFREPNL